MKMQRSTFLFLISLGIAVAFVAVILWAMHGDDPQSERRGRAILSVVLPLLAVMSFLGICGFCLYVLQNVVRNADQEAKNKKLLTESENHSRGFPVEPALSPISISGDGPGRYRIDGVDRASKMDATQYIDAQSAANAQVKAELEGMVVTSITKV
ncbi:MAG: hypothetical protein ABSF29_04460 [Tepidisphaeraceae bacterium]